MDLQSAAVHRRRGRLRRSTRGQAPGAYAASIDRIRTDLNARFPLPQGPETQPWGGPRLPETRADHQIEDPRTHGRGRTSRKQREMGYRALTYRGAARAEARAPASGGAGREAKGNGRGEGRRGCDGLCAAMRDPAGGADLCGRLTATWVRLAPRLPDGPRGPFLEAQDTIASLARSSILAWGPREIDHLPSDLLERIIKGKTGDLIPAVDCASYPSLAAASSR
jgi:hypothetical protein